MRKSIIAGPTTCGCVSAELIEHLGFAAVHVAGWSEVESQAVHAGVRPSAATFERACSRGSLEAGRGCQLVGSMSSSNANPHGGRRKPRARTSCDQQPNGEERAYVPPPITLQ